MCGLCRYFISLLLFKCKEICGDETCRSKVSITYQFIKKFQKKKKRKREKEIKKKKRILKELRHVYILRVVEGCKKNPFGHG